MNECLLEIVSVICTNMARLTSIHIFKTCSIVCNYHSSAWHAIKISGNYRNKRFCFWVKGTCSWWKLNTPRKGGGGVSQQLGAAILRGWICIRISPSSSDGSSAHSYLFVQGGRGVYPSGWMSWPCRLWSWLFSLLLSEMCLLLPPPQNPESFLLPLKEPLREVFERMRRIIYLFLFIYKNK